LVGQIHGILNSSPNIIIHLLQTGYDIRPVQDLLGHKDVSTNMIYTHVLKHGLLGVKSPAGFLK